MHTVKFLSGLKRFQISQKLKKSSGRVAGGLLVYTGARKKMQEAHLFLLVLSYSDFLTDQMTTVHTIGHVEKKDTYF